MPDQSRRRYEMRERASAHRATRDRILQATFEMHRRKGVAATTFADVAGQAGVAPATVGRHFPTMGDLVDACGSHVWRWLAVPNPSEIFDGIDDPGLRLERLVTEVCAIYYRGAGPLAGAYSDRRAVPQLDRFLRRFEKSVQELIRKAIEPREPTERDIKLAQTILKYGVWESLQQQRLDPVVEMSQLLRCVVGPTGLGRLSKRSGRATR